MDDGFAFGGVDLLHGLQQRQGIGTAKYGLLCVLLFGDADAGLRKKLLRFSTAGSTRAVVAPIYSCHKIL